MISEELLLRHIKTHSERSDDDRCAVAVLETFLRSNGRINTKFASDDKWPNTDGTFEYVSNPEISRCPEQNFFVQIKGTQNYIDNEEIKKYQLKSLAFPAFIYKEVTADPAILFVVFNPGKRGEERVFWKYMSVDFLNSIDYRKDSFLIKFKKDDELFDTDESIDKFCKRLDIIIQKHSFVQKLEDREYNFDDIRKIILKCDFDISEDIERLEIYKDSLDNVSRRIIDRLQDLCVSALMLNSLNLGSLSTSIQLAWEQSLLNIKTKYLGSFLVKLKYIGRRVPDDGQAERLIYEYYNFMWQIRKDLKASGFNILKNLENINIAGDETDKQYYEVVAKAMDGHSNMINPLKKSRYYIQKKIPFYVGGKRYFEITLQLAGKYATKFNRLTVYTCENINTNYSIQVGYEEIDIVLWNVSVPIKIITDWKVSIDPTCLNLIAKILNINIKISSLFGEYESLMRFLTNTGISLLDLIDFKEVDFSKIINDIYSKTNTSYFKDVLWLIRNNFGRESKIIGKNTVRYLLIRMKEEIIDSVMSEYGGSLKDVNISSKCYPFELNPFISNLAGSKTSGYTVEKDVLRAVGFEKFDKTYPYLIIKNLIGKTGEIYFDEEQFDETTINYISEYNKNLDRWEQNNGYTIERDNGTLFIKSYESETINVLKNILNMTKNGNKGQKALNDNFISNNQSLFIDKIKEIAIRKVFVDSRVMLIYGAAGTGKTTLINYISNLMAGRSKLFLAKTHAALQNLERCIDNPGNGSKFMGLDSFTKSKGNGDYDLIFLDECSIIDNRTMNQFLNKINKTSLFVLAGDIYQLEPIDFGNWFVYAKELIKDSAKVELLNTWRTNDKTLMSLWAEVRKCGELINEKLSMDGPYSEEIGPNILIPYDDDEVVLCLNYDGKFGLNNINLYFQANNKNSEVFKWQEWSYKIGDPILFNESKRFSIFYNNLKGRIVDIKKDTNSITFTVDINRLLTEKDCKDDVIYIDTFENATRVRFTIYEVQGDETEESRMNSVVPFQLSYAVSIHKSQGLEYNSVKVIIPESNSEKITHGIFYTAITRAKKKLKIYWSSETMISILDDFKNENIESRSLEIIKNKL